MLGSMPFEAGAAVATMAIGRIGHHPCAARVGADLLQAQLTAAAWTIGIKEVVRRSRPEGSGLSFPSGHTAAAFASATVLQQHFGWKVGIPAYAVASYVATSRVETGKHYWSDVAFAAALGVAAGRTISVGGGHRLVITPLAARRGGGAAFTLR
jgi:membrane-associated phospholipid phosphatase